MARISLYTLEAAVSLAVLGFLIAPSTAQQPPQPRLPGSKLSLTQMQAMPKTNRITIKFREGTQIRFNDGRLLGMSSADNDNFESAIHQAGIPTIVLRRLFSQPEGVLDAQRLEAQSSSGRQVADLNLYYSLDVPANVNLAELADRLNQLPMVEFARPAPVASRPPASTPDLTGNQLYKSASPKGVGLPDPATPGIDGRSMSFVDVEYSWLLNHEDLGLPADTDIDHSAPPHDPFGDTNHGTAVLGEIVAIKNAYGVTGIAPAAKAMVAPADILDSDNRDWYNPARAIGLAIDQLNQVGRKGGVILLEQQTGVCGGACDDDSQVGCGPLEAIPDVFDAISKATALGIVVVETAGNGETNLDDPLCDGIFNRTVRDSGAIVVGAGSSTNHSRLCYSDFGSRLDIQAWGENITTTGYGDAFDSDPSDPRRQYTNTFGGTSGAGPIVTGAVLAIQGRLKACGIGPASPESIRRALTSTGVKQPLLATGAIGPFLNVSAALKALGADACSSSSAAAGSGDP
jgi:serine protease